MTQAVDPAVSRAKFDREVARLRSHQESYARRGWLLTRAEFPIVEIAFVAMKTSPPIMVGAVRFDFTDHDVHPLSVRFIDPRTGAVLRGDEMTIVMHRVLNATSEEEAARLAATGVPPMVQNLVQAFPGQPAFLCLPGTREYHESSAHTGDPWEMHRAMGEGSMLQIAETIWQYGVDPVTQISVQFGVKPQPGVSFG